MMASDASPGRRPPPDGRPAEHASADGGSSSWNQQEEDRTAPVGPMPSDADEDDTIRQIADRLAVTYAARHPPERIRAEVSAAYDRFRGARVRDFIPILVERLVRTALNTPEP